MIDAGQTKASVAVVVLAHNEQRRIGRCLASLPCDDPDYVIHVVVNGSSDGTAKIVERFSASHKNLFLHDWPEPGKSRSWNRIVLDTLSPGFDTLILVDGDAEVAAGSFAALRAALARHPEARAASALPLNGRRVAHYRQSMLETHGIFGDLYALRGAFVDRFRAKGIRLPVDLIGDDGLVGALAKTDLGPLTDWAEHGIRPTPEAGFLCEPFSIVDLRSWHLQYRRMINYAVRHFQDLIITDVLRRVGPTGLPERLATLYPAFLPQCCARPGIWSWFDRCALARMAHQMNALAAR
jgi:glycosyltransferase involved in cell wall biosynthesis